MVMTRDELDRRAAGLALVLTDCDGCLTDTGVFYGPEGEVMKRFSIRDGMGMERLRNAGLPTAIITGERSPAVLRRAEKLKITAHLGIKDKLGLVAKLCEDQGVGPAQLAYFGDDVNDLTVMRHIAAEGGIIAAPADAMPVVRREAHYTTSIRGGQGAFRDFAEWLLSLRGASADGLMDPKPESPGQLPDEPRR